MNKLFIRRSVDGFVCALVLASIYILIIIAISYVSVLLPYSGPALQKLAHTSQWTFGGIKRAFYAVAVFGFVLGCYLPHIIRKRFTPKVVGFSVMLLIVGCFMYNYAGAVSTPREIKLADCTNNIVNIHLKPPQGHAYHLDLRPPGIQSMPNGTVNSSYKFSGHIRISSGASLITDFPISSDKARLTASGFVLTGVGLQNTNVPPLSQFIQAQKDYDIQITFDPQPPPLSSIWLYWYQDVD
jgi:hypothetical protein